jgi:hypothetical protein
MTHEPAGAFWRLSAKNSIQAGLKTNPEASLGHRQRACDSSDWNCRVRFPFLAKRPRSAPPAGATR